jgi:hypothetical protein
MRHWWHREGVLVIRRERQMHCEIRGYTILPATSWRICCDDLITDVEGREYLRVHGNCLNIEYVEPDLSDPGTLGFLEAAVRAAYKGLVVTTQGNEWWSVETDDARWDHDSTESFGEALVAALEAAE